MSTVTSWHSGQFPMAARSKPEGAFRAILWKEIREARRAIIAGLVIYWIMPALWEFIYAIPRPHDLGPGFAWILMLLTGWLYAAIIGAQTVCRDWGRPEEWFVLSRPVSPRTVIAAKYVAGLFTILLVVCAAEVWEFGLLEATFSRHRSDFESSLDMLVSIVQMHVPVLAVALTVYSVALAAAVLTRQLLASVMLASLLLLVCVTGPMVSSRLSGIYPAWMVSNTFEADRYAAGQMSAAMIGWGFVTCVVVGGIVSFVAVLIGTAPGRRIHLGLKPLAWVMGMVVLGLSLLAFREVGNSLPVRDQIAFDLADQSINYRYITAHEGSQFFITPEVINQSILCLDRFRIGDTGKIQDARTDTVPLPIDEETRLQDAAHPRLIVLNSDRLLVFSKIYFASKLWVSTVDWPLNSKPIAQSAVILPPAAADKPGTRIMSYAATRHYVYVVYATAAPADRSEFLLSSPHRLYIYDISKPVEPRLLAAEGIAVDPGTRVQIFDDTLVIHGPACASASASSVDTNSRAAFFDADQPAALRDRSDWQYTPVPIPFTLRGIDESYWRLFRSGDLMLWECRSPDGQNRYESNVTGLTIFKNAKGGHWDEVSQVRASPVAYPFRSSIRLSLLDSNLLLESTPSALILYDISSPAHPRRAGFLHAAMPNVFTLPGHLVLMEGRLVTVVDRPVKGRGGKAGTSVYHGQWPAYD